MKKILAAVAVFCLLRTLAFAQDPFEVTATMFVARDSLPRVAVDIKIPAGHYLYASDLTVRTGSDVQLVAVDVPAPKSKFDPFSGETVMVYSKDTRFLYRLEGYDRGGQTTLNITVSYLGCNDEVCFLPATRTFALLPADGQDVAAATRADPGSDVAGLAEAAAGFRLAGSKAGYVKPEAFLVFLDSVETGKGMGGDALEQAFLTRGVWFTILLILIGGLALNLTPCVLPMIPINVAIIGAGTKSGSRVRGFLLGGAYGLGIALVYGLLGVVAILSGSKFGTLNSSPWFNLGVAIVFFVLALSMFDVFAIDFSRLQARVGTSTSDRNKFFAAFALGGTAALLAGACVAPVLISVLLLAADLYGRGNIAGLTLPFVLGIGMALPWPFAGAGLSFLPKPGRWMERIKAGFGILIIAFAAWYGYLGVSLLMARSADSRGEVRDAQLRHTKLGWHTTIEAGLAEGAATGKPVFIDLWATWCKNCLKMEKTTFKDPEVIRRLDSYVKVKQQAEDLTDPQTRAMLDHFDVIGLPTYLVFVPREQEE